MDPSPKRITIKDLARDLGITPAAVSKALTGKPDVSQALRQRVLDRAQSLGYVPDVQARRLATGQGRPLGVFLLHRFGRRVREYFGYHLLDGILQRCQESGHHLLLLQETGPQGEPLDLLQEAQKSGVGALVVYAGSLEDPRIQTLRSSGLPLVSVDGDLGPGIPLVTTDQKAGMTLVALHLAQQGHEQVLYLGLRGDGLVARQRREGFLAAWPGKVLVREAVLDQAGGRLALETALDARETFTAVVCAADLMAYGVYQGLKARGIRPGIDIAVTGFDDLQASEVLDPGLTTLAQDPKALGYEAAHRALTPSSEPCILTPELRLRGSTLYYKGRNHEPSK